MDYELGEFSEREDVYNERSNIVQRRVERPNRNTMLLIVIFYGLLFATRRIFLSTTGAWFGAEASQVRVRMKLRVSSMLLVMLMNETLYIEPKKFMAVYDFYTDV